MSISTASVLLAFQTAHALGTFDELLELIEDDPSQYGFAPGFAASTFSFGTMLDVQLIHYARNALLETITVLDLIENAGAYVKQPDALNAFHQSGWAHEHNKKWTSADGRHEYILRVSNGFHEFVDDLSNPLQALNAGTYNFGVKSTTHLLLDVHPWLFYGNSAIDTSTTAERETLYQSSILPGLLEKAWQDAEFFIDLNPIEGDDLDNVLVGRADREKMYGGDGNDLFVGSTGADEIFGGAGSDTVDYSGSADGVQLNLGLGRGYRGDAADDNLRERLDSIEKALPERSTLRPVDRFHSVRE